MSRSSVLGIGFAVALLAFQVGGCAPTENAGGGAGTNGGGTAGTNGGGTAGTNGGGTAGTIGTGGSVSTTAGTNGGGTAGTNGGGTAGTNGGGTAGTSGGGTAGTSGGGTAGTSGGDTAGTSGGGTAGTSGGGTAGTTGAGGANAACPASITDKSTTCTQEGLACPKTCGIESKGTKTCTCTAGVFVCESVAPTCHYPAGTDLTCYRLPTPVPACPAGTMHNGTCTEAACMPCSGYADSGGAAKTGYCVCVAGKYKCASDKEWPTQ